MKSDRSEANEDDDSAYNHVCPLYGRGGGAHLHSLEGKTQISSRKQEVLNVPLMSQVPPTLLQSKLDKLKLKGNTFYSELSIFRVTYSILVLCGISPLLYCIPYFTGPAMQVEGIPTPALPTIMRDVSYEIRL